MAAPIVSLIDDLPNKENKIEVLEDLNVSLGNLPIPTVASVVANVSFSAVFDCLNTDNRDQLELTCDVLKKLLTPLHPGVVLNQFQDELKVGVSHDVPDVRKLCLLQILRVAEEAVSELIHFEGVLIEVVRCIPDESLDVAKCASNILQVIGGCSEGLDCLYSGRLISSLQDVLTSNDTIRFRVYETLVKICVVDSLSLDRTVECGLLQQFLNELHKGDILLQLNCLELMSDLALCEHGMTYLDQQGVIGQLEVMMDSSVSDPLAGFLIPGLVKFFGCVARLHPKEVCNNNETFVSTVFNNLSSPESPALLSLSIQTVGFIGSTIEGKLALEKLGNKMDTGVRCIGRVLRESQQDTKVITLQALNSLLKLRVPDQTSELLKLTEHWYQQLGTGTFDYLIRLVEQPFVDLRVPILGLFQALSSQPWGQSLMNNQPGFKEYLLDRSTEQTKEGKEGKFAIIYSLAQSPTAGEILGQPYLVLLKAYVTQGAFYVLAQSQVAMEGD